MDFKKMSEKSLKEMREQIDEALSSKQKNVVSKFPTKDGETVCINGYWAMDLYESEEQGVGYKGLDVSGHQASFFLAACEGQWFDEAGEKVEGYFYFKPKKQNDY